MSPNNPARRKILIVEDEKDLVRLLKFNLEAEGYDVSTVKDAEDGLTAARKLDPDLIVLDLMLPGMDGFQFCEILRRESDTPIVFLTASNSDICKKLAMKLGASDYLTKPFAIDMFLSRIGRILFPADSINLTTQ